MRDALGGTVSLVIVTVFIVIALGYMAFNVNYTKAFRMKDKIIALYDDFEGNCDSACNQAISDYADTLGYATGGNLNCPDGYTDVNGMGIYCARQVQAINNEDEDTIRDIKPKFYYNIITKINLQIPIISNVFDFSFFYIRGDTKSFVLE